MNNYFSFSKLFKCYTLCVTPFLLIEGVFSLIHLSPVYFNGDKYYGFLGFFISICSILFFGIIMGSLNWIVLNFGNFLLINLNKLSNKSDGTTPSFPKKKQQ